MRSLAMFCLVVGAASVAFAGATGERWPLILVGLMIGFALIVTGAEFLGGIHDDR